jgi:choline kinase
MLDSRAPPGGWSAAEKAREDQTDMEVRQLMDEAMLWRPASSAFWITWGIMQAPIPGLEEGDGYEEAKDKAGDEAEADSDEFDYLGYSQSRCYFFWGDMVQLGIVKAEELPESLRSKIRFVDH